MIYFLQPIWLWAASGIIVPVIIHLWNIKQGKTLKVGSIAFITESVKSQSRSLRISQWLLLLLRCLLIVVLAMLLAKPYKLLNTKEQGWIVVEKTGLKSAYHTCQSIIDSLQKIGYTLHYFDNAFEDADWKDTLKAGKDTAKSTGISYWTLLKALDKKVPADLPVCLFTDNRLQHFSGNRPEISLHLTWYTYPSTDSVATWLAKAYETTTDSIRAVIGKSSESGTYYTYQNLSFDNINGKYQVERGNGKTLVISHDPLHQTIAVDTTTLFITIYTDKYFADANYLKAAIDAIRDFTQHDIRVTVVSNLEDVADNAGWLFWLSEETIPASKMKNKVLIYENGKTENVHSALLTDDKEALSIDEPVTLYKYIKSGASSFQPVWKNSYDEPILSMQKKGAALYHFYSRFNPQWNDLVWSHSFPQIIYNLLFGNENIDDEREANDKRIMDASQMQPVILTALKENNKDVQQNTSDISQMFWGVAFLLLLLERIISFKQTKGAYE